MGIANDAASSMAWMMRATTGDMYAATVIGPSDCEQRDGVGAKNAAEAA